MGFVSAIVINNDLLSDIGNDPGFGKKVHDAVISLNHRRTECGIISGPGTAATAVACHHASHGVAILVGGGMFHHVVKDVFVHEGEEDKELALLKLLAEKHGFNLHKKRATKKDRYK